MRTTVMTITDAFRDFGMDLTIVSSISKSSTLIPSTMESDHSTSNFDSILNEY